MRLTICCARLVCSFVQAEDMRHKAYKLNLLDIGSQKQFFFDNYIIEDIWGVTRPVHAPVRNPANPILKATEPQPTVADGIGGTATNE